MFLAVYEGTTFAVRPIDLFELDCKTAATPVADPSNIQLGLDPERHRIILQHWFGVTPAAVCVDTVATAT